MRRRRRPPLITEIARLVSEYPADEWHKISALLRNQAFIDEVAVAADSLAGIASRSAERDQAVGRKAERIQARGKRIIREVAQNDSEKAKILAALHRNLAKKTILPSAVLLQEFAALAGMKNRLPTRREKAINILLQHLAEKNASELEKLLRVNEGERRDFGREYSKWVDLILGCSER